jgi:glycosyltransferase involved in cell wall biosynthesis
MTVEISVLQLCLRYPPAMGGVERYIQDINTGLAGLPGFRTKTITSDLRSHSTGEFLPPEPDLSGVHRLHARPIMGRWRYPVMQRALRTTLRAAREVQVVHGHGLYYEPYDLSVLAALTTRRPLVLSPYFYERHRWYWTSYLRAHRLSSSVPATIVAVSNYERRMLQRWGLAGKREIRVIYPRIDVPESGPRTLRERESDVLRCCFIGRISAAKGVLDLPAIVSGSLNRGIEVSLEVAGPDDGDLGALMKLVRRSRLEEHIRYVGAVSEEEKLKMLARSDALILPTRYEAFGIVLAEAMAHGCVPVAYAVV